MNQEDNPSLQKIGKPTISNIKSVSALIADLRALFKLIVLLANALPVFAGFWLALYFTDTSFVDHWGVFLFTIIGSTMVMAGALILNNWYDVDIDRLQKIF